MIFHADEAQLFEVLDRDERTLLQAAGIERDHDLGQQRKRCIERGWSNESELAGIGAHGV
jgi:hypothetical protein